MLLFVKSTLASALVVLAIGCTAKTTKDNRVSGGGSNGDSDADGGTDLIADDAGIDAGGGLDVVVDDGSDDEGDGGDSGNIDLNVLSVAYPEGMTIAMVPEAVPNDIPQKVPLAYPGTLSVVTGAGLLLDDDDVVLPQYDPLKSTFADKILAANKKLTGEGECFDPFLLNVAASNPPACYTPDTDLNFALSGPLPGGTPIDEPRPQTPSGEACMANYSRYKMATTVATVDRASGFLLAMLCEAKKAGLAKKLPAVGDELNLKTQLTTALEGTGNLQVEEAKVERLADANNHLRFFTQITVKNTVNGFRETIKLLHSPHETAGNAVYYGRLWIAAGESAGRANFLQINFERGGTESEPLLTFELVQGDYVADTTTAVKNDALIGNPFSDDGILDLSHGVDFNNPADPNDNMYAQWPSDLPNDRNTRMSNAAYIAFAMNPLTSVGKLMYWQNYGGFYKEAARGMVFNLEPATDNGLKGCSISGAAREVGGDWSIRKAQKADDFSKLKPTGYFHPNGWQGPDMVTNAADCPLGLCQTGDYVYRQCFVQNDAGKYVVDNAAMTGGLGFEILPANDAKVTAIELPDVSVIRGVTR